MSGIAVGLLTTVVSVVSMTVVLWKAIKAEGRGLRSEFKTLRENDLKYLDGRIAALDARIGAEMTEQIGGLRAEMTEQIGGLRVEMTEQFSASRAETMDQVGGLRAEMNEQFGASRAETMDQVGGLRAEMSTRIGDLKDVMNVRFGHVDTRIDRLDARVDRVEQRRAEGDARLEARIEAVGSDVRDLRKVVLAHHRDSQRSRAELLEAIWALRGAA